MGGELRYADWCSDLLKRLVGSDWQDTVCPHIHRLTVDKVFTWLLLKWLLALCDEYLMRPLIAFAFVILNNFVSEIRLLKMNSRTSIQSSLIQTLFFHFIRTFLILHYQPLMRHIFLCLISVAKLRPSMVYVHTCMFTTRCCLCICGPVFSM